MKALPLVLAGSLIVNTVLVVALVRLDPSLPPGPGGDSDPAVEAGTPAGSPGVAGNAGAGHDKAWAAAKARPGRWRDLESDEGSLHDLVARLRAEGCPPSILRAIIGARVRDQFDARRHQLFAGVEDQPYWTAARMGLDPKIVAAQRELYFEQTALLKELLGPDATSDSELSRYQRRRRYGDITADKTEQLQRIGSDYAELRAQVVAEANSILMPEDREKIAYLEKELRDDYAKILTSVELENYELRSSSTAQTLRSQLTTFQATEDEFRTLFRAARSVEDQFGALTGSLTFDQAQQRQAAFLAAASGTLSPARIAELSQATDPRYTMLNRVAARYELPTTVVPQVASVQQAVQQRAAAIRNNRALPAVERTAQLSALAQEANATLAPLLGPQAFEAYKQYGGTWIQNLVPRPPPNPTPAPGTTPPAGTTPTG